MINVKTRARQQEFATQEGIQFSRSQLEWRLTLVNFNQWSLESTQTTFREVFEEFQSVGLVSECLDIEDRAWLHIVCHHARKHLQELQAIAELKQRPNYSCEDRIHYYRLDPGYALYAYPQSQTFDFDRLCLQFLTKLGCTLEVIQQLEEQYEPDYIELLCQTWNLRSAQQHYSPQAA
jgi:hypothetical protein